MEQDRIQGAVLAELGRIWWTWQNMAECGRLPSDCRRLPSDCRLVVGLFLLRRWKQVDVCKVLRRSPVTLTINTVKAIFSLIVTDSLSTMLQLLGEESAEASWLI